MNIQNKTRYIMSTVFEVPVEQINEDTSPDNMEDWDSIRHMNLVVALEEEFNVEFNDIEIIEMLNMALIVEIIKNKKIIN